MTTTFHQLSRIELQLYVRFRIIIKQYHSLGQACHTFWCVGGAAI